METAVFGRLEVIKEETRGTMGKRAAALAAELIQEIAEKQPFVHMVFAAAPSQDELLFELCKRTDIPWDRVIAMHMDEYIGLASDAPQRFARYLKDHIFSKVEMYNVEYINSTAEDIEAERQRYSRLLSEYPVDIVCLGVGENGHIAFNDPSFADFNDPEMVRDISLDIESRVQQVNDGCFPELSAVPERAITLTIPALMAAKHMVCVVPGERKANAVHDMLYGPISTSCPASILRDHPSAVLFLDEDSSAQVSF